MRIKKLLTANYICKIEYETRFLFWKTKETHIVNWDANHVIYNIDTLAQGFFENYDTFFRADSIPYWYQASYDIPCGYKILSKECQVVEIDHSLEYLKNNMMSSDFIEYCKDEFGFSAPDIVIK